MLLCRVSLTPTATGNYSLSILVNGQPAGSSLASPTALRVHPGSFDLASITLTSFSSSVVAGQTATVYFRTFDSFGNSHTAPDLAFSMTASCSAPPLSIRGSVRAIPGQAGAFNASFRSTQAGLYSVTVQQVPTMAMDSAAAVSEGSSAAAGLEVQLAMQVEVQSALPIPQRTTASGTGLWKATVGKPAGVTVSILAAFALRLRSEEPAEVPNATLNAVIRTLVTAEWQHVTRLKWPLLCL